jgi:PHD/YefM family antitoxin component YafN of YafNO toxin-antitoxin module
MISTYHSHETRNATIRGKETVKLISVMDYSQFMNAVDLKDQLLHSCVIKRKRMKKCYMMQASEYLSSECHDNIQEQHRENNRPVVVQNSSS